jgi:predicted transcriptional regulator
MSEQTANRRKNGQFGNGNNIGKQFKPGQSGNLNGRRNSAKDILNKLLDTSVKDKTRRENIMNKLLSMAEHGNLNAIKEVLDRTDGKSREYIEQRITRDEVIIE